MFDEESRCMWFVIFTCKLIYLLYILKLLRACDLCLSVLIKKNNCSYLNKINTTFYKNEEKTCCVIQQYDDNFVFD